MTRLRPYFITPGCVGCWRFDEGTGTLVRDSSGYRNDGAATDLSWVDGRIGKAGSFNGSSSYVNCENDGSLMPTSEITVESWIYPTSFSGAIHEDNIASNEDNGYCLRTGNGYPNFVIRGAGNWREAISEEQININNWYHLIGTFNGTQVKIYVNGILKRTLDYSGSITASTTDLFIGRFGYSAERWFTGLIDEVRIYNRALSAEEIKAHFNYFRLLKHRTLTLKR